MKYLMAVLPLFLAACSHQPRQHYQMATVTKTEPVYRTIEVRTPRRVCEEQQVVKREADSAAPTIVGAIVGGVLGHAVGSNSSNKKVGMAAGAVIGGAIGNDVGKRNGHDVVHHQTVCRDDGYNVEYQSQIDGYQVTYQLNGKEYTTLLDRDPGPQMPVYVDPKVKNR